VLEFPIIRDLTEIALWPASCTCHRQHPELFSSSFSAAFLKIYKRESEFSFNFVATTGARSCYSDRLSLSPCLLASLSLELSLSPDFSFTACLS